MTVEELLARVQRMYASVDAVQEFDMTQLPAIIRQEKDYISVSQDFTGGLSQAEIENLAQALVYNIAHLDAHLRRWAQLNGKDPKRVDKAARAADSLKIIKDLSNSDKHPYPTRDWGHSRLAPSVLNIRRLMRLSTGGEAGSSVAMTFGSGGIPKIMSRGSGSANAVITGEVNDKDGNRLGDLYEIELEAVAVLEKVIAELGMDVEN
ncbi:MAG: hypothetical protein O2783_06260 [Chloroflexi bacterium]|nr:hypothetical protein [Chloroflexota bacterium]